VPIEVALIGSNTRDLEELLRGGSCRAASAPTTELARLAQPGAKLPHVVVIDIRRQPEFPASIAAIKKEHPAVAIVVVATGSDPALMLTAMRAGVNEWITEPIQQQDFIAAIERVGGAGAALATGEVFAVVGAKGGVGATTVAVNIATTLSAVSKGSTLLIDLHTMGGDAALFLGVSPNFSLADALDNTHRLDHAYLKGIVSKTAAGPDLLASPERVDSVAPDPRRVRAIIDFAAQCYRFVVLDVPKGVPAMDDAIGTASSITVVTTQELSAIRSGARVAAALRQKHGADRVRVVVNRYDRGADIDTTDLERAVGGRIGHKFPSNYRLAIEALNKGRPLVVDNHNKLASAFSAYAKSLSGSTSEEAVPDRSTGLLGRLTGRR